MTKTQLPTISAIIPAANEEKYIAATLEALGKQSYPLLEVIVVVNGCRDKTAKLARQYTEKVLEFREALGPSEARNRGAKVAEGDILLFVDADTKLDENVTKSTAEAVGQDKNIIGSLPLRVEGFPFKVRNYFTIKNFLHKTGILKLAPSGVFFSNREQFIKIGGFNREYRVGEFNEYIARAQKEGAQYVFLVNSLAITSSRRIEEMGLLRTVGFWVVWALGSPLGLGKKIAQWYSEVR